MAAWTALLAPCAARAAYGETLKVEEVLSHPGDPQFGDASTALRIGDEFWLGTPHSDRVAVTRADQRHMSP
jgi:hypothetical protein